MGLQSSKSVGVSSPSITEKETQRPSEVSGSSLLESKTTSTTVQTQILSSMVSVPPLSLETSSSPSQNMRKLNSRDCSTVSVQSQSNTTPSQSSLSSSTDSPKPICENVSSTSSPNTLNTSIQSDISQKSPKDANFIQLATTPQSNAPISNLQRSGLYRFVFEFLSPLVNPNRHKS
jgi:hypothetical protein